MIQYITIKSTVGSSQTKWQSRAPLCTPLCTLLRANPGFTTCKVGVRSEQSRSGKSRGCKRFRAAFLLSIVISADNVWSFDCNFVPLQTETGN